MVNIRARGIYQVITSRSDLLKQMHFLIAHQGMPRSNSAQISCETAVTQDFLCPERNVRTGEPLLNIGNPSIPSPVNHRKTAQHGVMHPRRARRAPNWVYPTSHDCSIR